MMKFKLINILLIISILPHLTGFSLEDLGTINDHTFEELFGQKRNELKELGKGGFGTVFAVTYQGQEWALKEGATEDEIDYLKEAQDSKAVASIKARFKLNGKNYLLMEKGKKSLSDLTREKTTLSNEILITAAKSFKTLLQSMYVENKDIKPDNILLMEDDTLKIIDPSSQFKTNAYWGNPGKVLARTLIENILQQKLTGGYIPLHEYFSHRPQLTNDKIETYRDINIASPTIITYWIKMLCEQQKLAENCENIMNFADLADVLYNENTINKIKLEEKEISYKPPIQFHLEEETKLLNPLFLKDPDYSLYFDKVEQIKKAFINNLDTSLLSSEDISNLNSYHKNSFKFKTEDDKDFRKFLEIIYKMPIKKWLVKNLLKQNSDITPVVEFIIKTKTEGDLQKHLLDLFNLR